MAQGIVPLLLVIPLAIAIALSSMRIEGSFAGERSNPFSPSVVDSSSTEHKLQQGENFFKPEAYAVTWGPTDQQSHDDVVARQDLFEPKAYPVRWKQPNQQLQGDVAMHQSSFMPEAYAVTWGPPDQQKQLTQVHSTTHESKSLFKPEAYAVNWGPPDQEAHGDVATHKKSFKAEAYPVRWKQSNQKLQANVVARQSSFMPEAYAVTWGPPDQQKQLTEVHSTTHESESFFKPEAYAVNWGPPDQQSHDDVVARQNLFEPEAYPVRWKQSNQQLQGDIATHHSFFMPEAYAITWGPSDQQSHGEVTTHKKSFDPEAYPVRWKQSTQVPDAAAEATSARGHGLHVETGMLLTRNSLLPGTVLPEGTTFGGDGFPDPQRFVLRADADAIPFSYSQLDTILSMFRIPRGSIKAEQVAATLRTCEAVDESSPDPHTCATSEQAATDFAAASLGVRPSELAALVTVVHGSKDAARYVVAPDGVARIGKAGGAAVPCHPMAYPYMVHYCHRPVDVEALRVELTGLGDDGAAVTTTAIAMCHANTTSWDARYFEMLNATRGEEICHFMPRNYVLWLPAADCRPVAVGQAGTRRR